jgi:tetratricopeptide (TPR) repeat protein
VDNESKALERITRLLKKGELTEGEFEALRENILSEFTHADVTKVSELPKEAPSRRTLPRLLVGLLAAVTFGLGTLVSLFFHTNTPDETIAPRTVTSASAPEIPVEKDYSALAAARKDYAQGLFVSARDRLETLVRTNPSDSDASRQLAMTNKQLARLAKEAYTRGYILESTKHEEEAKAFWKKGLTYVRPGDPYYDKLTAKLGQ